MKTGIGLQVMFTCALAVCALATYAAVEVDSSTNINSPGGGLNSANFGSYDASGAEKLVVLVGGGRDRDATMGISSVTYGGSNLTLAVKVSSAELSRAVTAGIYYLDDPGAAGDIVVNWSGKSWGDTCSITVLELSGAEPGHGVVDSSPDAATVSVTTSVSGSIVLAVAKNTQATGTGPTPQSPLADLSGTRHGAGYQIVSPAASVTPTFSTGDCTAGAVFDSLPPSGAVIVVR